MTDGLRDKRSMLCIGQMEASTCPPREPPGHLTFLKIIVQIPPYPGQNAVQMPHTRVHSGDQIPPPPGTFHGHKNDRRTAETPSVVEQNL